MGSKVEVPVFAKTNMGTRIAIAVSPNITAANFKREFERAHIDCFPELGSLAIDAVMVKRNSFLYRLPDSLLLKHVFQGLRNLWFLHVDASLSNKTGKTSSSGHLVAKRREVVNKNFADIKIRKRKLRGLLCLKAILHRLVATSYPLRKKKKRKRKYIVKKISENFGPQRFQTQSPSPKEENSNVYERKGYDQQELLYPRKVSDSDDAAETPRESFSGAVSVSGLIDRYFANLVEVDQVGSALSSEVATNTRQYAPAEKTSCRMLSTKKQHSAHKTHMRSCPMLLRGDLNSVALTKKYERSEVGKRLVVVSHSIGSSQGSIVSKRKKLWDPDDASIARSLVFDIDDND